jgi:hypothetical protein
MHSYLMTAFTALLFVVLTPGILLTLPSKASGKIVIALVHGLIFALIYHLTHKAVRAWTRKYEGFKLVCDEDNNCEDDGMEAFQDVCVKYSEETGECEEYA